MNKIYLIFFLVSLIFGGSILESYAAKETINEIYIESRGNNRFEAKAKAFDEGMRRSFLLLADKLKMHENELFAVSNQELKSIFSDVTVRDEKYDVSAAGAYYSATLGFSFRQSEVNQLVLKHIPANKSNFFEALVIPVFKINKKTYYNDLSQIWIKSWNDLREVLPKAKVYYPPFDNKLTAAVNMDLENSDLDAMLNNFSIKLYKKALIPTAEFVVDRKSGEMMLRVTTITLSTSKNEKKIKDYLSPRNKEEFQKFFYDVITDIVRENANYKKTELSDFVNNINKPKDTNKASVKAKDFDKKLQKILSETAGVNEYIMHIELFYEKQIDDIKKKLSSIKNIEKFEIKKDPLTSYVVKIYSNLQEENLASSLYFAGLSFYVDSQNQRMLINLEN